MCHACICSLCWKTDLTKIPTVKPGFTEKGCEATLRGDGYVLYDAGSVNDVDMATGHNCVAKICAISYVI